MRNKEDFDFGGCGPAACAHRFALFCVIMSVEETVTMYRPTGPDELELVEQSGFRRWPPRLPGQPIFYPVTNQKYAEEIARKWNVPDSGSGFVARFLVRKAFVDRYEVRTVGASHHAEWWIPADALDELNENIVGRIEVIARFGPERDY